MLQSYFATRTRQASGSIGGTRGDVRLELVEELAEPIVDGMCVDDLLERCELGSAARRATGRHEDLEIPGEHRLRAPQIDELPESLSELGESLLHGGGLYPCIGGYGPVTGPLAGSRRGRRYTRAVADESPELFDDIYLGLRAGGAARKQRRGEPLSAEEEEAIGRWQRLSVWRKFIAIGAFALGTFGLGFTVGGLIFGRWRTARR